VVIPSTVGCGACSYCRAGREPVTSAIEACEVFDQRQPGWIKIELLPKAA
jgi:adenine C2-methylase RlmN of 23S rRNA A2503 and tRNA A37